MTRADLIDSLVNKFPMLDAKDIDISVRAIPDAISAARATEGRIEIRDF